MNDAGDLSAEPAGPSVFPRDPAPSRPVSLLRLWFGVTEPVRPLAYALSGLALMLLKYAVEALAIGWYTGSFFAPWDFLNPVLSARTAILQPAPEWLSWVLFLWTLPFLWVAISMSVRRAADAGGSAWEGLLVLVPLFNLVVMLGLCFLPSRPGDRWLRRSSPTSDDGAVQSAMLGLGASLLIGAVMILVGVYLLASYGASLFLGTPLLMGAAAAYLHNRPAPRSYWASLGLGMASILVGFLALLLFAVEGLICVMMAAPLLAPVGAAGGIIGKAIADATRRGGQDLLAAVVALPLVAGAESLAGGLMPAEGREYEVLSAVEIDAPPEVVWEHVIDFSDLPEPEEWYFRWGIACPQRARIDGRGVGATRYCEFTTGTFVEPITAWDAPRRLAFDVTEQPPPMFELSPYRHVHPPHLDGYLRSNRGEFLMTALPGGRTRLEGRTWYEVEMLPQWYWTAWSDLLIHRIHERVLRHVKTLAEQDSATQ
jgi:uncharacterized membrane protein YhaH (DUF805 family)